MHKVVDYKLLTADDPDRLSNIVESHMEDGWVPSGTVVVFHDKLVQAAVKFGH